MMHGQKNIKLRKWIIRDSLKIIDGSSTIFLWSSSAPLSLKNSPINPQLNLIIHPSYCS